MPKLPGTVMQNRLSFIISENISGERLDLVISKFAREQGLELTRSSLKSQNIPLKVNGKQEKLSYAVRTGDKIEVDIPEVKSLEAIPQPVEFDLIYLDDDIAVVNKPYGLTVHPAKGHEDNTLVNGLLYKLKGKLSSVGGVERPGIVHRLDKDTAGLLIIALTDKAHHKLVSDFQMKRIEKIYHAIVQGKLPEKGRIDLPIGRSLNDRKKMGVREDGKPAVTEYRLIEALPGHSYVEINLLTGRTHQIRVHFTHLGHPIAGDPIYSRNFKRYKISGIALCAKRLKFKHPVTDKPLEFEILLPQEFQNLLNRLKQNEL